ncbi:hypothetical protein IFM89_002964 [Coptis chinensis]|uniref:Auxin-responsive protein n=1 Tax=Coptis chinensis TaxID=261450 RepID=A0A835M9P7_9MAGN|nr:hypothetical protein IFM89_002964 [Coptis chinensis]
MRAELGTSSLSLEHDYIGSTTTASSCSTLTSGEEDEKKKTANTELRLGLLGSESPPDRKTTTTNFSLSVKGVEDMSGLSLGVAKNFGTKRGFSDAIDGNGKWSGLDGDLSKGGVLFSPRAGNNLWRKSLGVLENNNNNNNNITQVTSSDVVVVSANVQEKKSQLVSARDRSPPSKAQVVGWPPIRSFRKNTMATNPNKNSGDL